METLHKRVLEMKEHYGCRCQTEKVVLVYELQPNILLRSFSILTFLVYEKGLDIV